MTSKALRWTLVVVVLVAGSCSTSTNPPPPSPTFGQRTNTYHDPTGWSVEVPLGWSVLPFETKQVKASSVGALVSNTPLPAPRIEPGLPIQTSGLTLPPRGISVVIATDDDPALVGEQLVSPPSPPLSLSDSGFAVGSCIAKETACLSTLWFTVAGKTLLISIKTGPFASKADRALLGPLVASIIRTDA
jgi:hypothetical protein